MHARIRPDSRIANRLLLILALALAGVFLWLAFRGADWSEMLATARLARLDYLVLAFLTLTVSIYLRGIRWGVLVATASPGLTMFWGVAVGYLGNAYLPARAGDVIRAMLVGRRLSISRSYALATTIVERVMDVLALVTISLIMLSLLDGVPAWVLAAARAMALVGLVTALGLLIAPQLQRLFEGWLEALPLPGRLRTRANTLLEQFLLGLRSFQRPQRALRFIALTVGICFLESLVLVEAAWALNLHLEVSTALMLLTSIGLATALPSTPGAVGIYQFVAVTVLAPFGVSQAQALVYIIGLQFVVYFTTTLWGLVGMWRLNVSIRSLIQTSARALVSRSAEKVQP